MNLEPDQIPIIACRPVNWPTSGPLANAPETPIYPGVEIQVCDTCKDRIYVGPRQQQVQTDHPNAEVRCFECVFVLALANSNSNGIDIINLGNPFQAGE